MHSDLPKCTQVCQVRPYHLLNPAYYKGSGA